MYEDAVWLWNAFISLSTQRQHAPHGPQPIAYSDMSGYCDMYEIGGVRAEFLSRVVSLMDLEFLKIEYQRIEQDRKKAEKSSRGSRRRR